MGGMRFLPSWSPLVSLVGVLAGCNDALEVQKHEPEPSVRTETFTIRDDRDDGTWIGDSMWGPYPERLAFGRYRELLHVEVRDTRNYLGLRFVADLPQGSHIVNATLRVRRFYDNGIAKHWEAPPHATVYTQVVDATDVAPFDPTHEHANVLDHFRAPLWSEKVEFPVGNYDWETQLDVTRLVQHVVSRDDWTSESHVLFFFMSAAKMDTELYADFYDTSFSEKEAAWLRVTWEKPLVSPVDGGV